MKQRRIKELSISHYEQGVVDSYIPSRTEEYASVLAQAEAHQDLRFHAQINGVEILVIFPWESVSGVIATYETVDVTAPHDDICDGVMKKDGIRIVTLGEGSLISIATDTETGEAYVTQHYVYDGQEYDVEQAFICEAEFPSELVESVIFNGEEVPKDGLTFHICHGEECDCPEVPDDETQMNFSVTAEIDGNTVCGCVIVHVE